MAHLIDKSEIAAEIEKMLQEEYPCDNSEQTIGYHCALYELQDFLNTLEVKEVDFETAAHGRIDYPFIGHDFPNIYPNYKELKDYCDKNGIKDEDKIKIIIIKDDIL